MYAILYVNGGRSSIIAAPACNAALNPYLSRQVLAVQ